MSDNELLERIAVAIERMAEELCKPLPYQKRPAVLGTATYNEEDRTRESLRAQLEAKKSKKPKGGDPSTIRRRF